MARFRATIQGQRGQASRLGGTKSGISATVNAWDIGIRVEGRSNHADADEFAVWLTAGSNGRYSSKLIGTFTARDFAMDKR